MDDLRAVGERTFENLVVLTVRHRIKPRAITSLWTNAGWLYLAIVLGLFNREVIGWSLKPRMTTDIVTDALTIAGFGKRPAAGLMHHSDRASQYASHAFQDKREGYGMTCSMRRKGNCWDNAPTESCFNSFKNERVPGIRYSTHAAIKATAFECIELFYNRKRPHSTRGYGRLFSFWNTGSGRGIRKNGEHETHPLADEKPRETQSSLANGVLAAKNAAAPKAVNTAGERSSDFIRFSGGECGIPSCRDCRRHG